MRSGSYVFGIIISLLVSLVGLFLTFSWLVTSEKAAILGSVVLFVFGGFLPAIGCVAAMLQKRWSGWLLVLCSGGVLFGVPLWPHQLGGMAVNVMNLQSTITGAFTLPLFLSGVLFIRSIKKPNAKSEAQQP